MFTAITHAKPVNIYNSATIMQLVINSKLNSIIGVHSHERLYRQEIRYQIIIKIHEDYYHIKNQLKNSVKNIVYDYSQNNQPKLLEKFCYDIALIILNKYSYIYMLDISIKKPCAVAHADYCYVRLSTH